MRRLLAAGAVLTLAGVLAGFPGLITAQTTGAWPSFHGNATRSGLSTVNGPTSSTAVNQWQLPQATQSSPVVDSSGTAYIGDDDGNVYALSPSKPTAPKWTFAAGGKVVSAPTLSSDGKTLYVGTTQGNLYAIDTATGKNVWGPTALSGSIQASPTLSADGGTLFVPNIGGQIYAVSASSGSIASGCPRPSAGAIQGSLTLSPDGATLYAATSNEVMIGIPTSGVCSSTSGTPFYLAGPATSSPAVDANGTIYVASGTSQGEVMAFNPGSGTAQWTYPLTLGVTAPSTPGVGLGLVVIGASNHHVYALSASTGTAVWNSFTGDVVESSPVIAGGNHVIYFGSDDGNIYAYDSSGAQLWTKSTGAPVSGSPALGPDNTLWAASRSGAVYRIGNVGTPPPPASTPPGPATSTPSPTATPGPTSTPSTTLTIKVTAKKQVKAGAKQTVKITGTAHTLVHIRVTYPNGDHQSHPVTTNAKGTASYTYKQGASKILHNRFTATVVARVGTGANQVSTGTTYKILFGKIDVAVEPRTQSVGKTVNVWIHTKARTRVVATLLFPNRKFKRMSGKTGPHGWAHLRYKVGKKLTKGKNHKTSVVTFQASHPNISTKTTFTIK